MNQDAKDISSVNKQVICAVSLVQPVWNMKRTDRDVLYYYCKGQIPVVRLSKQFGFLLPGD